jgi:hypothetical protein
MEYTKKKLKYILDVLDKYPAKYRGTYFSSLRKFVKEAYYAPRKERQAKSFQGVQTYWGRIFTIPFDDLPLYLEGVPFEQYGLKKSLMVELSKEIVKIRLFLGR